jgi:tRNA nucleotidyltransferase (CCA-adding enzyme)
LPALANPDLSRSGIYRSLETCSSEAITACLLACEDAVIRSRLELYLIELRYVKPSLNGEDLKRMGVTPGPRLGKMLKTLHDAKLDNKIETREEEEALVRQWIAERKA